MEDIITKLCCCAMFAVCCMDGAEGMNNRLQMSDPLSISIIDNVAVEGQPQARDMSWVSVHVNLMHYYIRKMDRPVRRLLLDGNLRSDIRAALTSLQTDAESIVSIIPNLNRALAQVGIEGNSDRRGDFPFAYRTVYEFLSRSDGSICAIQRVLNNLQVFAQSLLEDTHRNAINNEIDNIRRHVDSMDTSLALLIERY